MTSLARARRDAGLELDHVIIETSGLADPAPLVELFFAMPAVARALVLDAVVTVADASHIVDHLRGASTPLSGDIASSKLLDSESKEPIVPSSSSSTAATRESWWSSGIVSAEEAGRQIAFADVVLLNKVDRVEEDVASLAESTILELNPCAHIVRCTQCVPVGESRGPSDPPTPGQLALLSRAAFGNTALPATLASDRLPRAYAPELRRMQSSESSSHVHAKGVSALTLHAATALSRPRVEDWLRDVLRSEERWRRLFRVKGRLALLDGSTIVLQGVHSEVHLLVADGTAEEHDGHEADDECCHHDHDHEDDAHHGEACHHDPVSGSERSRYGFLVLIGKGLADEADQLQASFAALHVPTPPVTVVADSSLEAVRPRRSRRTSATS